MQYHHPLAVLVAVALFYLAGCSGEPAVSYQAEIRPIIDKYCTECHLEGGDGTAASGFLLTTYDDLMKGTRYGPVIVPEHPLSSSFYRLVAGKVDKSIRMPHGKEGLAPQDIVAVERWILQGAKNN